MTTTFHRPQVSLGDTDVMGGRWRPEENSLTKPGSRGPADILPSTQTPLSQLQIPGSQLRVARTHSPSDTQYRRKNCSVGKVSRTSVKLYLRSKPGVFIPSKQAVTLHPALQNVSSHSWVSQGFALGRKICLGSRVTMWEGTRKGHDLLQRRGDSPLRYLVQPRVLTTVWERDPCASRTERRLYSCRVPNWPQHQERWKAAQVSFHLNWSCQDSDQVGRGATWRLLCSTEASTWPHLARGSGREVVQGSAPGAMLGSAARGPPGSGRAGTRAARAAKGSACHRRWQWPRRKKGCSPLSLLLRCWNLLQNSSTSTDSMDAHRESCLKRAKFTFHKSEQRKRNSSTEHSNSQRLPGRETENRNI